MNGKLSTRPPRTYVTAKSTHLIRRVALGLLAAGLVLMALQYPSLPDTLPIHYNLEGEVDGWGGRWTVLLMGGVSVLVVGGTAWISHYPRIFNYAREVSEENAQALYQAGEDMMVWIMAAASLLFTSLLVISIFPDSEWIRENGILMVMIYGPIAIFGALIAGLVRILRA